MTHEELCHGVAELARAELMKLVRADRLDISCGVTFGPRLPAVLAICTSRYGPPRSRFGSVMLCENGLVTVVYDRSPAIPGAGFRDSHIEVCDPVMADWLLVQLQELIETYKLYKPITEYELLD